ncbi:MAG: bifunctional folylpolyglutamate synthase/dihydrofolate synthase [Clostridia bacterium]|nr:bifunctional folylpolyglutamate synthase/dihydrofolate synthase [Clostridia bacterium]
MTGFDAINYIHSYGWRGSIPGLSRTFELLHRIGDPQKKTKFIHIVGTNGKGSTAAMLASVLQKAGYVTGLYTSPYILTFHERMQVNGEMISDDELGQITEFVMPHAEAMEDHATEFELVTTIALEYFARHHCDIVVLEAGMGGEMDSTNVIDSPEIAVFTNIGLDHTEYLGDTMEKIAKTKAGILKQGSDAVCYRGTPSVETVLEAACAEKNIPLHKADFDSIVSKTHGLEGQTFDFGRRKNLFLPLLGDHQLYNAAVVLTTLDVLKTRGWRITEENIHEGLRKVRWPGRFEVIRREPLFIVDGGHNPQCMEALAQNIRQYLNGRDLTVLTGVLRDKDYTDMYRLVAPFAARFVTVTPPNPRALTAEELAEELKLFAKPIETVGDVRQGVRRAISLAGKDGVVLAFGSLYMVGDIRDEAVK